MLLLVTSCLYFCCCNSDDKRKSESPNTHIESKFAKSDTVCFSRELQFNSDKIKLLNACHIIYNDSLSEEIAIAFGNGKLPGKYNFDKESTDLEYTVSGDTVDVKLLLMVKSRGIILMPDTIYWDNDTLCLKEKGKNVSTEMHLKNFKFEEFNYRFLVKDKESKFYFRHK